METISRLKFEYEPLCFILYTVAFLVCYSPLFAPSVALSPELLAMSHYLVKIRVASDRDDLACKRLEIRTEGGNEEGTKEEGRSRE